MSKNIPTKAQAALRKKSLGIVMIFVLAYKDGYRAGYEDAEKKFKNANEVEEQ